MKAVVAVIAIIVLIAAVLGGAYVSTKNQIVTLDEQVKSNWAQVDVVLQRRADLIPNLVSTVKGFAAHEETVFDDIAKARTQYMNAQTPADKIAASNQIIPSNRKSSLFRKIIPNSNPTKISSASRMNWPAPKIASPSNASAITIPSRPTTPTSVCSLTTSSPDGPASNRNNAYFQASETSREVPKVEFPAAKP